MSASFIGWGEDEDELEDEDEEVSGVQIHILKLAQVHSPLNLALKIFYRQACQRTLVSPPVGVGGGGDPTSFP